LKSSREGILTNPAATGGGGGACGAALKQSRKIRNDDYDKFCLPTGSGFTENPLELSARRFVTDVKLGRSGPQCFSCDEMKRQSGLRWRQPKVTM
jgi:hypothetical protein